MIGNCPRDPHARIHQKSEANAAHLRVRVAGERHDVVGVPGAQATRQLARGQGPQGVVLQEEQRPGGRVEDRRAAVGVGLFTLLALTLASFAVATLIIWLYVRGNVIMRSADGRTPAPCPRTMVSRGALILL